METSSVTNQEPASAPVAKAQLEQKEAVYTLAVSAVAGAQTAEGTPFRSLITKEVRKAIRVGLYAGIKDGSIKYTKSSKTDGELKKYCSSLINNWLKKDPRFN